VPLKLKKLIRKPTLPLRQMQLNQKVMPKLRVEKRRPTPKLRVIRKPALPLKQMPPN